MDVWNKGIEYGPRRAFTPSEVLRIRKVLKGNLRDLVLLNTGIDTMLRGSDLLSLKVSDVKARNGVIRSVIDVPMSGTDNVVRCTLSFATRESLKDWIKSEKKFYEDDLFTGRNNVDEAISLRQLGRIVKRWAESIGLDPTDYGTDSLRRTRATYIVKESGNLEAVRTLLGLMKISSVTKYLGEEEKCDPLAVSVRYEI
jgi:integrase